MICVTIGCGSHKRMIDEWQKLAKDNVSFVELRLDYLRKEPQLYRLLPNRPTPVLASGASQVRRRQLARFGPSVSSFYGSLSLKRRQNMSTSSWRRV